MNKISEIHFSDAVTSIFKPLADRAHLDFQKLRPDIYQIAGPNFVLRLRRGTGHYKDVLITLAPSGSASSDLDDLASEIGLNVIAEYHGFTTPEQDLSSTESFYATLREVSVTIEKVCMPYLLGKKSDFDELRALVARKIEEMEPMEWRFPPNVREEWIP